MARLTEPTGAAAKAAAAGALALAMIASAAPAAAQSPPAQALRVGVSSSWAMPLMDWRDERVRGGIVPDVLGAISRRVGLPLVYVVLPRARLDAAALAGDFDLRCYVRPAWTQTPTLYAWSGELFQVVNVLIGHIDVSEPAALADVPARSVIGTTRAFTYTALEPGFASGQWHREDAIDQEKLMLKLALRRHPYAVVDVLTLGWFLRQTPKVSIADWRLPVSQEPIHCAVPKAGNVPADTLLPVIERLRSSGELQRILDKYR